MDEHILLWNIGQLIGFVLLLRYLQIQIRDTNIKVESVVKDSYTKTETNALIDLKLKPIEVGIAHVQKELSEVKHMIGRLLDEKNH